MFRRQQNPKEICSGDEVKLYIYIYSLLLVHVKKGLTTYRSVFGLLYTVSQLYFFGTRVVR